MNVRNDGIRCLVCLTCLAMAAALSGCDGGEASETEPAGENVTVGAATGGTASAARATELSTFNVPEVAYDGLPLKLQMKIGAYRQDVVSSPSDALKVAQLGAIYYVHGFPQEAVACFRRARELRPSEFVIVYTLGMALQKAGDTAGAIDVYRESLEINPQYEPAHRRLALLLEAQGKVAEAEQHRQASSRPDEAVLEEDLAERILLLRGFDVDTLLNEAVKLAREGQNAEAQRLIDEAAAVDQAGHRSRNTQAAVLMLQGQTEQAIGELRAILHEAPDFLPAKVNLAAALGSGITPLGTDQSRTEQVVQQQRDEARGLLREVLEAEPDNIDAIGHLATLTPPAQRIAVTVPLLEAARGAAADDVEKLRQIAAFFEALGRLDEAVETARMAVELKPNMALVRVQLGKLMHANGDEAGARREWEEALRIAPTLVGARIAIFESHYQKGEYTEAEKTLREGLASMPTSDVYANALAWLLATCPDDSIRNGEEAVALAERACEITKHEDFTHLDTLAAAYAEVGRFDDARKWATIAVGRAREAGLNQLAQTYARRKQLYDANQPCREGR